MNFKLRVYAALALVIALCQLLYAEIEVRVTKGAVRVDNISSSTTVVAGQKVRVKYSDKIIQSVDDELVPHLLKLDQCMQKEIAAKGLSPQSSSVQVHSIEDDSSSRRIALFAELANNGEKPRSEFTLGPTAWSEGNRIFDAEGNLLDFVAEKHRDGKYTCKIKYGRSVSSGEKFNIIISGKMDYPNLLYKQGEFWFAMLGDSTKDSFGCYELVLPESAVFVAASSPVVASEVIDGRLALVFRKSASDRDGGIVTVKFLWPDKNQQVFSAITKHIVPDSIGTESENDSPGTPAGIFNSMVNASTKDELIAVAGKMYMVHNGSIDAEVLVSNSKWQEYLKTLKVAHCPKIPSKLVFGYIHPLYMTCADSQLGQRVDTLAFVYLKGQWYYVGNTGNPVDTDVTVFEKFIK